MIIKSFEIDKINVKSNNFIYSMEKMKGTKMKLYKKYLTLIFQKIFTDMKRKKF